MPNYIIPTIFSAKDQMTGVMGKIGMGMKALTGEGAVMGAALTRDFNAISAKATAAGMSATLMGAAIIAPLALATNEAVKFEKAMGNVATLVDTNTESMAAMGDEVLKMSKQIPVSISDLTESLYQIRSAGVGAADAMNVLAVSSKLSVAGLSTATEATKAVTSAMVDFKTQGLSTEQIANSFFLTVKEGKTKMDALNISFGANAALVANAGLKLQEFNGVTAALTNTGMEASLAQIGVANTIISLIKPTTEMLKVYKKLNIATGEQIIQQYGYMGAMDAVAGAAKNLNIEPARLFNKTGLKTAVDLQGGVHDQAMANIKEQMAGVNALNEAYAKQFGTSAAQIQLFKNNVQGLGIALGSALIPALNKVMGVLTPIITGIGDFAKNHKDLMAVLLTGAGIIGGIAITYGGFMLAIGAITKATWLWGMTTKVVTGLVGLNSAMVAAAIPIIEGFTGATLTANEALLLTGASAVLLTGGIFAVVGALGWLLNKAIPTNTAMATMGDELKKDKKGFVELAKPITAAQLALNKYNEDMTTFIHNRDALAQSKYNDKIDDAKRSGFQNVLHDLKNSFMFNDYESDTGSAPKLSNYPGADTTHTVSVVIDNQSGNNVAVKYKPTNAGRKGGININVQQTG